MPRYHVTYFYLATGMEGQADTRDLGYINANSASEAKYHAARATWPDISEQDLDWAIGCLTAKEC